MERYLIHPFILTIMTMYNTLATCKEILTAHEAGVCIEVILGAVVLLFLGAWAYKAVTSTWDLVTTGKDKDGMFAASVVGGGFFMLGMGIIVAAALL